MGPGPEKGARKSRKQKKNWAIQKKFSYFGPQIYKLLEPRNTQALGWLIQSVKK